MQIFFYYFLELAEARDAMVPRSLHRWMVMGLMPVPAFDIFRQLLNSRPVVPGTFHNET